MIFLLAAVIAIGGSYSIRGAGSEYEYLRLIALFTLITAVVVLILAATKENLKHELTKIIDKHIVETKILKNTHDDVLAELKMLRHDMKEHHSKK